MTDLQTKMENRAAHALAAHWPAAASADRAALQRRCGRKKRASMKQSIGVSAVNDDEWHTPRATADVVAAFAAKHLGLGTPILCPADILPDGTESEIPKALRAAGLGFICLPAAGRMKAFLEGLV